MSSSGASIGSEVASDVAAVEADVKAFVQRVETTIEQDAEDAYAWLKAELAKLSPEVLAELKAAVATAIGIALGGTSTPGTIVADVLTILANDGSGILARISSDVVSALVGLTGVNPSGTSTP